MVCGIDEYLVKEKAKMQADNTFNGIDWNNPEEIKHAVAAADNYGEIFVS